MQQGFKKPPVKEGGIYELDIMSMGDKGDGIGKIEGFVIIVPGTEMKKSYMVKITRVMPKVAFAEVVENKEDKERDKEEGNEQDNEAGQEEPENHPEDTEDFGEEDATQ